MPRAKLSKAEKEEQQAAKEAEKKAAKERKAKEKKEKAAKAKETRAVAKAAALQATLAGLAQKAYPPFNSTRCAAPPHPTPIPIPSFLY